MTTEKLVAPGPLGAPSPSEEPRAASPVSPAAAERHVRSGDLQSIDFTANRHRTILKLALPTVVAMVSQSVVNDIDVVFFRQLGGAEATDAQAALIPSLIIVWLFGGSLSAVSVGTQALTARRYAEGDLKGAGAVLTNGAFFCLTAGALFSVLGYLLLPSILRAMSLGGGALDIAISYSRWRMLGVISMAMTMAIKAFFDGIGKTRVHFVAALTMNVVNVGLCWTLIYGNFGMPRMGAPGAGLAAFLATWIGLGIMIAFTARLPDDFAKFQKATLSRKLTWDILKLSIPAALATIVMMGGFGVFEKIVGALDRQLGAGHESANGAATTDIIAVLKLTFTACIAFGTATATLVGQSLGANRPADAMKFGWASVRLGLVFFGVIGMCEGVFFTPQVVHFICSSPEVEQLALVPMRMMGVITPVIAVAMILSEALFGAGSPRFVAAAQLVLVVVLVSLAYVLGVRAGMGLVGIWLSACIYSCLAAITMALKFRTGDWKTIKL